CVLPIKPDQPGLIQQPLAPALGTAAVLIIEPGAAKQFAQSQITLLITGQQQKPIGFVAILLVLKPDIATCNGFDTSSPGSLVKLDEPEQVGQIRQGHGRLSIFGRFFDKIGDTGDTVDY